MKELHSILRFYCLFIVLQVSLFFCVQHIKKVDRCPETKEEWKQAAEAKKCGRLKNNCTVFHCLMVQHYAGYVEICSERRNIIGHCAVYSNREKKIVHDYDRKICGHFHKPCLDVMKSDEILKYPFCVKPPFRDIDHGRPTSKDTTNKGYQGIPTYAVIILVIGIIFGVMVFSFVCYEKFKDQNTTWLEALRRVRKCLYERCCCCCKDPQTFSPVNNEE